MYRCIDVLSHLYVNRVTVCVCDENMREVAYTTVPQREESDDDDGSSLSHDDTMDNSMIQRTYRNSTSSSSQTSSKTKIVFVVFYASLIGKSTVYVFFLGLERERERGLSFSQ